MTSTLFFVHPGEFHPPKLHSTHLYFPKCSMVSTLTKLGEGAFAEVFGCQNGDKEKLALKVPPQYIVPLTVQEDIAEPLRLTHWSQSV